MKPYAKIALPVLILAVAIMVAAWLVKSKPQLQPAAPQERVWTVAVAEVERQDIRPEIRLFGEVVAGRAVELRALVAGEVVEVGETMVEGGLVHKGDLLIAIDEFDYRAGLDEDRAQLREARARLDEFKARLAMQQRALTQDREMVELSRRELQRAAKLADRGTVSDKALDSARMELTRHQQATALRESELQAEQARIAQQEAQIVRAEVAVRRAERDLANIRLTAPFAGFLSDVQAELGQRLGLNDRVARLVDAGRLEAAVTLSDAQFGRLTAEGAMLTGAPAQVLWRVGGRELAYQALVERTGARIETASGGIDVYVRIRNTGLDGLLRPGAFVEVRLSDAAYVDVVRLPESTLYDDDTVYAVDDGRLTARTVSLLARVGNDVLLRGALRDGDRIVMTRYAGIGPGQKVRVR